MTDYKYQGLRVPGLKAEDAYEELERIREERGLTPQNVVDESRPKEAVLHPAFEWRDKVAAEEYRKHQARHIIRSVVVTRPEGESHVYTNVTLMPAEDGSSNARKYERSDFVVTQPGLYEAALMDSLVRLRCAVASVEDLQRASKSRAATAEITRARKLIEDAQGAISALQ